MGKETETKQKKGITETTIRVARDRSLSTVGRPYYCGIITSPVSYRHAPCLYFCFRKQNPSRYKRLHPILFLIPYKIHVLYKGTSVLLFTFVKSNGNVFLNIFFPLLSLCVIFIVCFIIVIGSSFLTHKRVPSCAVSPSLIHI